MNVRDGRPGMTGRARRGTVVGILALVATILCGLPAQAAVIVDPGGLGGEVLGNPVPGPVVAAPNIFPLPPPPAGEPGFVPAPGGPESQIFPLPDPRIDVRDGPGSGPTVPPPVQVDADTLPEDAEQPEETASSGNHEPVGKLSRVDEKFLKRKGVDAHDEKIGVDLRPPSLFDIYIDREGTMFGVRKGTDPKFGTFIGPLPD